MSTINERVSGILKANDLDFLIKKGPLQFIDDDRKVYPTPYYGIQNATTKEVINTVKEGYTISQNEDVVKGMLLGMEKFGDQISVHKAGSISGGRRIFIQLKLSGKAKVGKDTIEQYIMAIDSNDGSTGLAIGIGDKAMHCKNQFFRFYKGSQAKFRHTATINEKIATIPKLIELALDKNMQQVRIYKEFLSTPVTKELASKMVKEVLGYDRMFTPADKFDKLSKRQLNIMNGLYEDIETEYEAVGENVWGLFNGLTRYTTHEKKKYPKENGKMESMLLGTNYNKARDGYNFLVKELQLA